MDSAALLGALAVWSLTLPSLLGRRLRRLLLAESAGHLQQLEASASAEREAAPLRLVL